MIIRVALDVHLNEEDDVTAVDEAEEATREALLELTSDNLLVDEIFNNEGLTGPNDTRVLSVEVNSQVSCCFSLISPRTKGCGCKRRNSFSRGDNSCLK